jgi:hypothetical protein
MFTIAVTTTVDAFVRRVNSLLEIEVNLPLRGRQKKPTKSSETEV